MKKRDFVIFSLLSFTPLLALHNLTSSTSEDLKEVNNTQTGESNSPDKNLSSTKKKRKIEKKVWIGVKYDTLDNNIKLSTNIRIQFPSLFSIKKEETSSNLKKKKSKNSFSSTPKREEKKKRVSPFNFTHSSKGERDKNNTSSEVKEIFSAKLGTFFLKYRAGLAGGIKNQIKMEKLTDEYNLTFSSVPELYILKFNHYTHWRNDVDVKGERDRLFYNWHLYTDWYPFDPNLELGTRFTFHDTHFPQLNSGFGVSYDTDSHDLEYRLFLYRNFYHRKYLKRVGGYISHFAGRGPFIYTYKVYARFEKRFLRNNLIVTLTPYLLYSKEYDFKLKPEVEIECKYYFYW